MLRAMDDEVRTHHPLTSHNTGKTVPADSRFSTVEDMNDIWAHVLGEYIPTWIMAISAVGALSAFVWRKQDKREALESERKNIIKHVHGCWVKLNGDAWGIKIHNGLEAEISDVTVECIGHRLDRRPSRTTLVPGDWFFYSDWEKFAFPVPIGPDIQVDSIPNNTKRAVTRVAFSYLGERYERDYELESSGAQAPLL